jgi:uncharacterized protein
LEFDWDPAKHDKILRERGFSFADVVPMFSGPCLIRRDDRRDYGEARYISIGCNGTDMFTVVFTDRGHVRWIITAWPAIRKERAEWQRSR